MNYEPLLPHHRQTLDLCLEQLSTNPSVQAVLLVGSIAHGFARDCSDVDVLIIVDEAEYRRRLNEGALHFLDREVATYAGGYVDGKYLGSAFLDDVERRGSEPARYAFADARLVYGGWSGLEAQLERIARYPVQEKAERIERFYAQLHAWHWYVGQALRGSNDFLLALSASKLGLFAARLILAHNEQLFPYYKWLTRVLGGVADKPEGLVEAIEALSRTPSEQRARRVVELVDGFRSWSAGETTWPVHFQRDVELAWQRDALLLDDA